MHQSHNIPWGILSTHLKVVYDDKRVTPNRTHIVPINAQDPSLQSSLAHFTRMFASTIRTFSKTERKKYPTTFNAPTSGPLFSDALKNKYPKYLNSTNQDIAYWIAQGPRYHHYFHGHEKLAAVITILIHEKEIETLLMLANHPLIRISDLHTPGAGYSSGWEQTKQEPLSAYIFINTVEALNLLDNEGYTRLDMYGAFVTKLARGMLYPAQHITTREFFRDIGLLDAIDNMSWDLATQKGETIGLALHKHYDRLQRYLKKLFEVLYTHDIVARECGLDGPTGTGKSSVSRPTFPTGQGITDGAAGLYEYCGSSNAYTEQAATILLVNVVTHTTHDSIFIIDSPGFADNHLSEVAVVKKLRQWMAFQSDKAGIEYILYFHRINDKRVSGSQRKTLELVKTLIGSPKQYTTIGAITTMWDTLWRSEQLEAAEERYAQLKREFLETKNGLNTKHIFRFKNNQKSALDILDEVLERRSTIHGFRDPPFLRDTISPQTTWTLRKTPFALPLYNLLLQRIGEVQQQIRNIDEDIKNERAVSGSNEELLQVLFKNKVQAEGLLAELEREKVEFGEPPEPRAPSVGLTHRLTQYFKDRISYNKGS
ncbi:hypothetical protein CVT24_000116 [Panaeolus cyanescens]|uniref:G domain-containing protein n=1 Tax=Panaeolus cyanescens TaxID=181874 RepID=A0A409W7L9_9AGAR|nr:hypothetical protein CVT24_000116 [Panaeolus cyanescens]